MFPGKPQDRWSKTRSGQKIGYLKKGGPKHVLARRLAHHRKEDIPVLDQYTGDLSSLPTTASKLMKLSVSKLKEILHFHGYNTLESKETLALRVLALRSAEAHLIGKREVEALLQQIEIMRSLARAEQSLYLSTAEFVRRQRAYVTAVQNGRPREHPGNVSTQKSIIEVPDDLSFSNMEETLNPFKMNLGELTKSKGRSSSCNYVLFMNIGLHVLVKWTEDDNLQEWKPGELNNLL